MSLGIAIKSAEGIVLAADSRVTLFAQAPAGLLQGPGGAAAPAMLLPATYDSATKLLSFPDRKMGAITFGQGSIGTNPQAQRTAASFLTEFERALEQDDPDHNLSAEDFARRLGQFFRERWDEAGMPANVPWGGNMIFYVGGFTADEPIGRLYELSIPSSPEPTEKLPGVLGGMWGGQREIVDRIISGFDPRTLDFILNELQHPLAQPERDTLNERMKATFQQPIPWALLPLRDCVHIAVFLVRATIAIQGWSLGIRGVGGEVDVATITRSKGFEHIKVKEITAEPDA
jgi:hypothetical protein